MTKTQVLAHFAEVMEVPKSLASAFFEELAELAAKEAQKSGAFSMPGIGKLTLTERKARMGRNPATGESIEIPAKTVVKMKLSKAFQEMVVPGKK